MASNYFPKHLERAHPTWTVRPWVAIVALVITFATGATAGTRFNPQYPDCTEDEILVGLGDFIEGFHPPAGYWTGGYACSTLSSVPR